MSEARQPDGEQAQAPSADAAGLDAGGHEVAPPSDDHAKQEARESVQDAFDDLAAIHSSAQLWDEASRRADRASPPGAAAGSDAGSDAGAEDASAGPAGAAGDAAAAGGTEAAGDAGVARGAEAGAAGDAAGTPPEPDAG